jgi:hypothetical protein
MYTQKKLCTHKKMYTKKCVHTKKHIYTKKNKKTNIHLFHFVFFVYTNIRVNNFLLCEKACLWHALDSQFKTLASYFSYCTKMESCKNLFCALSFSPKKSISSKTRDFSRTRFVASQRQLQENVFTRANLFGGAILLFPPI